MNRGQRAVAHRWFNIRDVGSMGEAIDMEERGGTANTAAAAAAPAAGTAAAAVTAAAAAAAAAAATATAAVIEVAFSRKIRFFFCVLGSNLLFRGFLLIIFWVFCFDFLVYFIIWFGLVLFVMERTNDHSRRPFLIKKPKRGS